MTTTTNVRTSRACSCWAVVGLAALLLASGCAAIEEVPGLARASSLDPVAFSKAQADLTRKSGEIAEQQGKLPEAIRHYEQARLLHPEGNEPLARRLAVLYDRQGEDTKARSTYEELLQQNPHDADLLNDYGVFYLTRDDGPTAEHWLRQALLAQPGHQRAKMNLGKSLALQGRLPESHQAFAEVVGPAAAYSNLGVLLAGQGRTREARDHFQRALALDASLVPARDFLAHVDSLPQR